MQEEMIELNLSWSEWKNWNDLKLDARSPGGVVIPSKKRGVYEVKLKDSEERLYIGAAHDLRRIIKQGLVKGMMNYPAGKKIRKYENTGQVFIRWAFTEDSAAKKALLLNLYQQKYHKLPKYVTLI